MTCELVCIQWIIPNIQFFPCINTRYCAYIHRVKITGFKKNACYVSLNYLWWLYITATSKYKLHVSYHNKRKKVDLCVKLSNHTPPPPQKKKKKKKKSKKKKKIKKKTKKKKIQKYKNTKMARNGQKWVTNNHHSKAEIVAKVNNNLNCDKTQKLKLCQHSKN